MYHQHLHTQIINGGIRGSVLLYRKFTTNRKQTDQRRFKQYQGSFSPSLSV